MASIKMEMGIKDGQKGECGLEEEQIKTKSGSQEISPMENHLEQVGTVAQGTDVKLEAAPDGGFGWVMVFGVGMALSIITGFNKSCTLFYEQLLQRYNQSAAVTAGTTSMAGTLRMVTSPLVSALINHTSHKTVGILAGITCSLSIILTAFMPSIPFIYATYGFTYGTGVAMFIVSDLSMVNLYFSKNRGKANALRSCFLGIGALYMTQLQAFLYGEYGFRGCLIIIGALMLNLIPAAGLFRPLRKVNEIRKSQEASKDGSQPALENSDQCDQQSRQNAPDQENMISLESNELTKDRNIQDNEGYYISPPMETASGMKKYQCNILMRIWCGIKKCGRILGLSALRNPGFCACAILMTSFSVVNSVNMSFLAGLALEKGYKNNEVTWMMSLNFATEIPCRLLSGVLFDLPFVRTRRFLVFTGLSFTLGIVVIFQPFIPVLIPSVCFWMLQSGLLGCFHSQSPTVMSDTVPRSTITSSVGVLRLMQGIGNLSGPFIGGFIRDITGSYTYGYVVAGVQISFVSLIIIILSLCCSKKKTSK